MSKRKNNRNENYLNPMESSTSPPTESGIPETGPEILQIKIEEEEPYWEHHLNPMESSAGPIHVGGFLEVQRPEVKLKEEEPQSIGHVNPMQSSAYVPRIGGLQDMGPEISQIKKEEPDWAGHLNPNEQPTDPLTGEGIPGMEPEIIQIKIEKEEPDWEDHQNPMESSAGLLTNGAPDIIVKQEQNPRLSVDEAESKRRWDELMERLKNRPELQGKFRSFQNDPSLKRMRGEVAGSSEESTDDSSEGSSYGSDSESSSDHDPNKRAGKIDWCICGNCCPMNNELESLCCMEIDQIKKQIPTEATCITANSDIMFECTDRRRVDINFKSTNPKLARYPKDADLMQYLRKSAYRLFVVHVYDFLGVKYRKPIPSCFINKVRSSFPDPPGKKKGLFDPQDYHAEEMALD
ncbi:hypothetical protein GDO86_020457 [Hymenochirus boettgeri]|nr:hypothetical protein GDO86_020457 [Hymenochirus boettgeri]KAG8430517.1 hypothetical protein GDO86_020457 [Hymenochirus boettgeri]